MDKEEKITYVSDIDKPDDNVVQTFQLVSSSLRGRIVRLGSDLDKIITDHNYPDLVTSLFSEVVALTVMLSSMLKYEGIFTLQIQGDGILKMLVCDVTADGNIRGCANFDKEAIENTKLTKTDLKELFGKGYMAFTVDRPGARDPYQGIVEIKGESLVDAVQHYFNQSEQIGTGIKLEVDKVDGKWRAGALMLQHMPEEGNNIAQGVGNAIEDNWRRAMILMETCTKEELIDPNLHSNILLRRLFHEEGIRVYEPYNVKAKCRCSKEKVENVISVIPEEEREEMSEDGKIIITCEFCSKDYYFDI